jgi:predicted TIM-barrel fold metal-dependent hydrolase
VAVIPEVDDPGLAASPDAILASLRRFYFDTALSAGPALPTLKAFAGPGHILFGTDSPMTTASQRPSPPLWTLTA